MFDVITFGTATKDIFLQTRQGSIIKDKEFLSGEGICFSLGSKVKTEKIHFSSGGGGTNTAATLAKQGFSVAYCGKIGEDGAGDNILKEMDYYGVDSRFISFTSEKVTNHSVVLDIPGKDRTIFAYKGASDLFSKEDISLKELNAEWFYLAPFSENTKDLFYFFLDYAISSNIKVMVNPSKAQLRDKKIKEVLGKVDVLLLNLEEAAILTNLPCKKEEDIIRGVAKEVKGIAIITKGKEGVFVYDGQKFYSAKPTIASAVDRTGAGDSFGAGFLSSFIREGDVKEGIQLGIANSTSCLQKMGAKHGLLGKSDKYEKVEIHEFK